MKINNINLKNLNGFIEEAKKDKSRAKRTLSVSGKWNLKGKQFTARVNYEKGSVVLKAEQPTNQGGKGTAPNPNLYCLFGLASCFASTIATIAASKNVKLDKLEITAEASVNLSKSLGLGDEPIPEKVRLLIDISTKRSEEIGRIIREAEERCPAMACLQTPIKPEIEFRTV